MPYLAVWIVGPGKREFHLEDVLGHPFDGFLKIMPDDFGKEIIEVEH